MLPRAYAFWLTLPAVPASTLPCFHFDFICQAKALHPVGAVAGTFTKLPQILANFALAPAPTVTPFPAPFAPFPPLCHFIFASSQFT